MTNTSAEPKGLSPACENETHRDCTNGHVECACWCHRPVGPMTAASMAEVFNAGMAVGLELTLSRLRRVIAELEERLDKVTK
jgi:hypothetical protein